MAVCQSEKRSVHSKKAAVVVEKSSASLPSPEVNAVSLQNPSNFKKKKLNENGHILFVTLPGTLCKFRKFHFHAFKYIIPDESMRLFIIFEHAECFWIHKNFE